MKAEHGGMIPRKLNSKPRALLQNNVNY